MPEVRYVPPRQGRPPKYDWDTITDGYVWVARQGDDFDCTVSGFKALLRYQARKRGMKVKTKVENRNTVRFQFRST